MSQPAPIVKLEDVDVDIDGRCVLRGITLDIARGRHFGVVGANGSGKSTLLALLAGKRWPAPGRGSRVYDFGAGPERDAVTARERVALIGHELQDLYFARGWNFRVRDIVLSGLGRSDIPRRHPRAGAIRAAEDLLRRMHLDHLANRRLLELSRGEQRRVLITRALAFDPALLLLDEPASGLDASARAALEHSLRQAAQHTQIVVAAHHRDDLPGIVTTVAALEAGRLRPEAPGSARRGSREHAAAARAAAGGSSHGEPVIALEQASVWLDGRRALANLDWTVREGEHWLITGANGAGKSTLLRLLHGELRPALGGRIRWPGLGDPSDVWTLRRRIALVSPALQARYLLPTRVADAVGSGFTASIGRTRRLSAAERAEVDLVLARLDLEPLRDRLLTTLSYGQRHRALIARTLVTRPRVLLLDEPWEGLDRATSEIVRHELSLRMVEGTQVICVSHVGPRGLELNRTLELEDGRVVDAKAGGSRPQHGRAATRVGE